MTLVERDVVLAEARECIRLAREGFSTTLLVTGPMGIGRTAVLDAIDGTIPDDLANVRVSCAPMEQDFALGVVSQIAYSVLDLQGQEQMSTLVDAAAEHHPITPPTLHEIHRLFAATMTRRTTVLLVDDVHWIDDDSARWLAYLSNRDTGWRLCVIATLRDAEVGARRETVRALVDAADVHHALAPLSRSGSDAVLRAWTVRDPSTTVDRAHRASRGVPLLLRAEVESPRGRDRIRDRIAANLRAQDPRVRSAITAIAVLAVDGVGVDHVTAASTAALGPMDFDAAVETSRALGLLIDGADLVLHPMIRDAATATMSLDSLNVMHRRTVDALGIEGVSAERMARHVLTAGVTCPPDIIPILRTAAADARVRGAPETASDYLRHALASVRDQTGDRIDILLDLADVERGRAPSDADRHLDQALALIDEPRRRAAAIVSAAPTVFHIPDTGNDTRTSRALADLGSEISSADDDVVLRLRTRLLYQGRGTRRIVRESVGLLHALDADPPLASPAHREHLAVLLDAAVLTNALPAARIAAAAHTVLDHEPPSVEHVHGSLTALVPTMIAADDTRGADRWLAEVLGHARRLDLPFVHQIADIELALLYASRGELRMASTHLRSAMSRRAPEREAAENLLILAAASIALQSGNPTEIDAALARAQPRSDDPVLSAITPMLIAAAAATRGQPHLALENYLACGRRMHALGWEDGCVVPWAVGAIEMHHLLGHHRDVDRLIEQEQARVDAWGTPAATGRLMRTRARTMTGSAAHDMLDESLRVLSSSENQLELFRTATLLADEFDDREAGVLAARLALLCGVHRSTITSRTTAARSRDLTAAEREVATLAMDGSTNSEIALRLGVSVRAVEKHLTNTYRKLRISGRSELSVLEIS